MSAFADDFAVYPPGVDFESNPPDISGAKDGIAAWFESKGFDSSRMSGFCTSDGTVAAYRAPKKQTTPCQQWIEDHLKLAGRGMFAVEVSLQSAYEAGYRQCSKDTDL